MQLDGQTIALYYRVSDKYKQGDNFSIESQQDMKAFCQKAGATVLEFIEMEGASEFSKGLDRTELNKVMELARQKKIDGIMYYIANRFTRDIADGILLRRELYRLGIKLYCYYPYPREITNDSELLHVFEDYGSQQYVRNLRESTMRGYRKKVEKGLFPKGIPPYGYVVTGRKDATTIHIHNEYGRVVQNIFHWAAYERLSTGEIAKRLNSMNITAPGELIKRAKKREKYEWTYNAVYQILKDTAYKGIWYAFSWKMEGTKRVKDHSNRVEISIPRIVDDLTWEMVQNRPKYQKQHDHTFLLTGYAKCICGAPIIGTNRISSNGNRLYYYKCAGDKRVNGKACQNYYRCDYVDYHVWQFVKKCVYNPDYLLRLLDTDTAPSLTAERITALQEEIKGYQEELDEAIILRLKTKVPAMQKSLDARAEQIGETIQELENKITQLRDTERVKQRAETFKQSISLAAEAIRENMEAIERYNDSVAMRRVIALFHFVCILSTSNKEKFLEIRWNNSLERINVSTFDTSLLLSNLITLLDKTKITPA